MASAPDQRPQFIQFNLSTQWSLRKPYCPVVANT